MRGQYTGYWELTGKVLSGSQARCATLLVAAVLAHLADRRDDGWTSASLLDLMEWTGYAKQTVLDALADLVSLGELEVQPGRFSGPRDARRSRYRLRLERSSGVPKRRGNSPPTRPLDGPPTRPLDGPLTRPLVGANATADGPLTSPSSRPLGRPLNAETRPSTVYSTRSNPTPQSQSLKELTQSDPPDGVSANTLASAHVSNVVKGDDSVVHLFPEDSQQPAAPVQASMQRAAGQAPVVVPLVDVDKGEPPGTVEVREMARVALSRLVGNDRLRPLLAELGWNEEQHGKVTDWLAFQSHAKLREIIAKAHDAVRKTPGKSRPVAST